jgi:CCR4-NOT transcriptional regulation complex NOT5 subunit
VVRLADNFVFSSSHCIPTHLTMGDRKESKKSKKSHSDHKSHKKHKKHRSRHDKNDSPSSEPEIDYNDPSLWSVEKTIEGVAPVSNVAPSAATAVAPTAVDAAPVPVQDDVDNGPVRDTWMTDAGMDFTSFGTVKQKAPKEEKPNPDVVGVNIGRCFIITPHTDPFSV